MLKPNVEGCRNGSANNQRNTDCIYEARHGIMAYNSNSMCNSSLHLLVMHGITVVCHDQF